MAEPAASSSPADMEASKERIMNCGPLWNWYEVLGLKRSATLDEIKKTYRKLCLWHHPDKSGGDARTFKVIHKGYQEGVRVSMVRQSNQMKMRMTAKGKAKVEKADLKAKAGNEARAAKEKRRQESKAFFAIRRVVQRVREADPESLEGLEKELQDALEKELENCGRLKQRAEKESSRGLAQGRKRVKQIQDERKDLQVKANQCDESQRARRALIESVEAAQEASKSSTPLFGGGRRVQRPRAKPLAANATKAKLQSTISKWDTGSFKGKTMPDEVKTVPADTAATWLQEGSCVPVDVRSERSGSNLLEAASFTYFQFLTTPEELAPEVHRLREEKKRLVVYSQDGAAMGPCGLVGSLLLDVFGFDDDLVYRLQGGYDALKPLMGSGSEDGVTLEAALNARKALTAARKAQKDADTTLAKAKADLVIYSSAQLEHLQVLSEGSWASEDVASEHLSRLSPLLTPLKLESSLTAMLGNSARKKPADRGLFDKMVFDELCKRFEEKVKALQEQTTTAAEAVSETAATVKKAESEVEATRKACGESPTKKAKLADGEDVKDAD